MAGHMTLQVWNEAAEEHDGARIPKSMPLKERDALRKALVQYYANLISLGATRAKARRLLAAKAKILNAPENVIPLVIAQVDDEDTNE